MITEKSNVLVLICGEYRTFDVAINHSWNQFKTLPNFHLYFSTWDFSYQGNDLLDIHYKEDIKEESIKKYFDKEVYVNVMNLEKNMPNHNISHSKTLEYSNDAVSIHLRKLTEISSQGEYQWDYIILTRPDLLVSDIDLMYDYKDDTIYTPYGALNDDNIIHDTFFIGKSKLMRDFICYLERNNAYEHHRLKNVQNNRIFKFNQIPTLQTQIIRPNCRNINTKLTFKIAQDKFREYDMEKELIFNKLYDK